MLNRAQEFCEREERGRRDHKDEEALDRRLAAVAQRQSSRVLARATRPIRSLRLGRGGRGLAAVACGPSSALAVSLLIRHRRP
jgi:hypothetical protein